MLCSKTESQTHTKLEIAGHTIKNENDCTNIWKVQPTVFVEKKKKKWSLIRTVNTTF